MNPKQISPDDLILFALQDMAPAEATETLLHLEHNEAARAELAHINGALAAYSMTSEMHDPPALARERLMRQIGKERKVIAMEARPHRAPAVEEPVLAARGARVFTIDREPAQRARMGFATWAGWAIAAGCALVAGLEYRQHQNLQQELLAQNVKLDKMSVESARAQEVMKLLTDGGAMQVALHLPATGTAQPPKPEGHTAYSAETGRLVFVGMHLAPLEIYKTYELWVIPADGQAPIPAGLFKPDARGFASVVLPQLPKGVPAKTFGVTIEDDGGSKAPTAPIVLAGM